MSVLEFHKASFTLLNEWANIKSVSVLNISDDEFVLKDVYNRVSSRENFVEVFDGFWKVYEFAVRNIPEGDLSKNHGVFLEGFKEALLSLKDSGSFVISNRVNLKEGVSEDFEEALKHFKLQVHDSYVDSLVSKYFS